MGAWSLPDAGHVAWRRRLLNIAILSAGWCLAVSAMFINITTTSLAAAKMASLGVATYPLAAFIICSAATALPGTLAMKRWGRRPVFLAAAGLALVGAGLQLAALYKGSYGLLLVGAALQGPSFSQSNNYRFVAAEFSPPAFRPRAISFVVVGGVFAAAVGPEAARHLREALPQYNAGPYILLMGLYVVHLLLILLLDYQLLEELEQQEHAVSVGKALSATPVAANPPAPGLVPDARSKDLEKGGVPSGTVAESGQDHINSPHDANLAQEAHIQLDLQPDSSLQPPKDPQQLGELPAPVSPPLLSLRELLWHPTFVVAAATAALSFAGMAALMAVTPVQVAAVGLGSDMSAWVVEVHIVAMYLPGLLMGDVMKWTGAPALMIAGAALLLAGNGAFLAGSQPWVYFLGMTLIGLGWCAAYVAASFLVAGVYAREPRRRLVVQGATDTCVIAITGVAIGTASTLLQGYGWNGMLYGYLGVHTFLLLMVAAFWAVGVVSRRRASQS